MIEGQVFVDGGESNVTFDDIYRQDDLVAYWTLDDLNSSDVAVNQTGNDLLDGSVMVNLFAFLVLRMELLLLMVLMTG